MLLPMDESPAPFDEFAHSDPPVQRGPHAALSLWIRTGFQGVSFATRWLALLTAIFIVVVHACRLITGNQPGSLWTLKSAIPLIAIGISYVSLIATIPRTAAQRVLGFLVGLAFVLWGMEQFMRDQKWISLIDDIVVLLFVLDLSLVIGENLRRCSRERKARQVELPLTKPS
jgi:hypothetical protein